MSVILLGWTEDGGDIRLDDAKHILRGPALMTEFLVSLHTDCAPEAGDPVPEGIVRRGNWQRSFDPNAIKGSKLWMLRYVRPVERARVFAELWSEQACAWMVTTKRVLSVTHTAERKGRESILITHDARIDEKTRRRFATELPYGF
jgi:phage gp46-like protein